MIRIIPILALALVFSFSIRVHSAPKNVVMFVVDDQGLDAGCYGNPVIQTPNLDQLAQEGTRFTNAFCTTASCSASRSVILSGLQNHANGQYGHMHSYNNFHSHTNIRTLPVILSASGYRTASVGKYHVQPEPVYHFDQYLKGNQGGSRNPVSMANLSEAFIRQDSEQPFFLYFCTSDPHRGGGYATELPFGPNYFGNNQAYDGVTEIVYRPEDIIVPSYLPDTPECRAELAQYYQSVSRIDQGLGRLIKILKESNQYENTLILYLSDNGIAFPGAKTTLYDPGMNLPLIVRSPDQTQRNLTTNAMVSWVDLTPTILDFAGIDLNQEKANGTPYRFHGKSFLDLLSNRNPNGWDVVYASHTFHEITMYYPMRVIRNKRFKYILNLAHQLPYPFASDLHAAPTWQGIIKSGAKKYGKRDVSAYLQRPRHELYNVEADPHEIVNLADNPEFTKALKSLQSQLKTFQEETRDPWIVKYKYE
ncbi:MAG: sulfatase [Bacteroidetes Order II. Incertae sedis bacterium]|jgi:N-sulfoglucosamine sulfohydrolase|nr:sulfatase [Bacteroidetes Order II. bacterium]